MKLWMNRSLFVKLFLTTAFITTIGILTVVILSERYYRSILTSIELQRIEQSVDQTSLNLDNRLNLIVKDMFDFIAYSPDGRQLLGAKVDPNLYTDDMNEAARMLNAFRLRYPGDVESAFFYRDDGVFFYDYSLYINKSVDYRKQQWYLHFEQQSDDIWTPPTNDRLFYQDQSPRTIYLTMGMYGVEPKNGIFVVRLSPSLFSDAFRHLAGEHLRVSLTNPQRQVVFTTFDAADNRNTEGWVAYHTPLSKTGFQVNVLVDQGPILDKVKQMAAINLLVIVLVLVAAFLISLIFSLTLTKPLRKLLMLMKSMEKGDFSVRFPVKYQDEIGKLGFGFNHMAMRLSSVISEMYMIRVEKAESELRQKEATIKAMQSQINPHFLYNTLEVINCHAIVSRVPSISQMSTALAEFFRYSIEQGRIVVTLDDEVRHVRMYLKIQAERYPDIDVDMDIPADLLACPVVKLTLQPILENAFAHAFRGDGGYWLRVTAASSEGVCRIRIEDNGEGMDPDQMRELNRKFTAYRLEPTRQEETDSTQGIGLWNVHIRLRLQFGERYGLKLSPACSGGLIVDIDVPDIGKEAVQREHSGG